MQLFVVHRPIELRRELRQFCNVHLVFQLVWIAPINTGHGSLREQRFQSHDGVGVPLRRSGVISHQFKDALNVLHVPRLDLFGFVVVFGVVVAIRKTQPALIEFRDLLLGIIGILRRALPEENRAAVGQLQTAHNLRQLSL